MIGFAPTLVAALAAATPACPPRPPVTEHRITHARWVSGAVVTEYYPIRESWFLGRAVSAPGVRGRHRVDWLYGPHGVAMNGEGLGVDGRYYHFAGPYGIGWVNANGGGTTPCWNGTWTRGKPAWLALGWRNRRGRVTYPLADGGWSDEKPTRFVRPRVWPRFGAGRSRQLPFWHAVATDPRVIPRGSRVFLRAYCHTPAHGWFRALDTGGAIIGFHVDVYRPPPRSLVLHSLRGTRMYVVPPGAAASLHAGARC
jgi:3D domain